MRQRGFAVDDPVPVFHPFIPHHQTGERFVRNGENSGVESTTPDGFARPLAPTQMRFVVGVTDGFDRGPQFHLGPQFGKQRLDRGNQPVLQAVAQHESERRAIGKSQRVSNEVLIAFRRRALGLDRPDHLQHIVLHFGDLFGRRAAGIEKAVDALFVELGKPLAVERIAGQVEHRITDQQHLRRRQRARLQVADNRFKRGRVEQFGVSIRSGAAHLHPCPRFEIFRAAKAELLLVKIPEIYIPVAEHMRVDIVLHPIDAGR